MQRSSHTHNGRHILRTGPLAPLLGAAFNYIGLRELGWEAKYGIKDMCADSWNWQKNNPNGYED